MNVTLSGKTALITGAASGIGCATVLTYLDADAAVGNYAGSTPDS